MCADHDIYRSIFESFDRLFLLFCCAESGHHAYSDRIIMKSLCKCIVMLLCKDRGWYEIRHLFSIVYCLKCCTDRYFCLAIPDISTDQSVHDLLAFHIPFRIIDRI